MKRRSFIKNTTLGVPALLNGVQAFGMGQLGFFSSLGESDKILVLLQLNGGNDGLNTVMPLDQYDNLYKVRQDIILGESDVLKIRDDLGFHPMMHGMHEMYNEGLLHLVQGVGYPNQNRSHFRSRDIWFTGSPAEENYLTGWLGRHLEVDHPTFPTDYPNPDYPDPIAIAIGSSSSKTCQGTVANFSFAVANPANASTVFEGVEGMGLNGVYAQRMDYLRSMYHQTNEYGGVITKAYDSSTSYEALYEDISTNRLSQQMHVVGQLIEGGLQTKVYIVQLGGFDTHGDQAEAGDPTSGRHPILLDQLSKAIRGFQNHIEAIGKSRKVLGMTFSEFGRRIKANGSYGTDHGSAAPVFLFGECVRGGILGNNAEIADAVTDQEGVAMQHDFRSIYATILRDWFDVEEGMVKSLLHEDVQFLSLLNPCGTTSVSAQEEDFGASVHPSPAHDRIQVRFESQGWEVKISVLDSIGYSVGGLSPQKYPRGVFERSLDVSHLPAGAYFVLIQSGSLSRSIRFVKI